MKKALILLIITLLFSTTQSAIFAKSGCCSWHKGVCGCSPEGRTVCCDGTLSPTCTCTLSVLPTSTPTPTLTPIPTPTPTPTCTPTPTLTPTPIPTDTPTPTKALPTQTLPIPTTAPTQGVIEEETTVTPLQEAGFGEILGEMATEKLITPEFTPTIEPTQELSTPTTEQITPIDGTSVKTGSSNGSYLGFGLLVLGAGGLVVLVKSRKIKLLHG